MALSISAVLVAFLALLLAAAVAVRADRHLLSEFDFDGTSFGGVCLGGRNECTVEDMTLDAARRGLAAGRRYISYGALRRDRVPCGRGARGRSYYACGSSGRANPYRRGCSQITHCARNTRD